MTREGTIDYPIEKLRPDKKKKTELKIWEKEEKIWKKNRKRKGNSGEN